MPDFTVALVPYQAQKPLVKYDSGQVFREFQRVQRGIRPVKIRTLLESAVIEASDQTVLANSADPISLTLPRADGAYNLRLNILNVGAGTLTVIGTINASVDPTFAQYEGCQLHCDGVVYWKIGAV